MFDSFWHDWSMRIDLHTHSSVSDGTDSPTRLVINAQDAGLDVIALTDHDTFDGVNEAIDAGRRLGVQVIPGVEMSTKVEDLSIHLLGYGPIMDNRALNDELARVRQSRQGRIPLICAQLREAGVDITEDEVIEQAAGSPSVGRPHVADVMVAKGITKDRSEAFEHYLLRGRPGYVSRYATPLPLAIQLIHAAGGVAVIAHPWGRHGDEVLTPTYITNLVTSYGLDGIEVDHTDHDQDTRALLSDLGYRLGLVRTGGSDYHGTGKPNNSLGCNLTRETALNELSRRVDGRLTRMI